VFSVSRVSWVSWIWGAAIAVVITGELLPGNSPVLAWAASLRLSDKEMHFAAYLLLATIPALGFEFRKGIPSVLSMILLGVVLEFAQRLIPGRNFEIADMVANTLGVLAGLALALTIRMLFPSPHDATAPPAGRD